MLTPNQTGRIDSPEGALDAPLARIYTGRGSDSALEPCSQHEREVGDRKGDDPALRPSRRQLELCHSVTARAVVSSLELSRFGQRGRRVSGDLFASVWRALAGAADDCGAFDTKCILPISASSPPAAGRALACASVERHSQELRRVIACDQRGHTGLSSTRRCMP